MHLQPNANVAHPMERFLNLLHAAAKECVEIMEGRGKTWRVTGHNILSNTLKSANKIIYYGVTLAGPSPHRTSTVATSSLLISHIHQKNKNDISSQTDKILFSTSSCILKEYTEHKFKW